MKKCINWVINDYLYESCFIALLIIFLFISSKFFFPLLIFGFFIKIIQRLNSTLHNSEKGENEIQIKRAEVEIERKKFLIQYIIVPAFLGLLAYLITDRVYGCKETIIIGISNASYSDTVDFSSIYHKEYISKANELLGGYHPSLQFDIVTISGKYEEIWTALREERIDIAFISPYNFQNMYEKNPTGLIDTFEVIGGKYTGIGSIYHSGFLLNKKKCKEITNLDSFLQKLKAGKIDLLFSGEDLSTSGWIVPNYWLEKNKESVSLTYNRNSLPDNVGEIYSDSTFSTLTDKIKACTFSSDMWHNMKSISPKLAEKLKFIKIDSIDIQMDPVVVKRENWATKSTVWHKFEDLLKLRNTDVCSNRHSIIIESLRYVMDKKKNEAWMFGNAYKEK